METISANAVRTREQARDRTTGKFQTQHKAEPGTGLSLTLPPVDVAGTQDAALPTGDWSSVGTRERAGQMLEDLDAAISEVVADGRLGQWMDSMRSNGMGRWSFNNRALAAMQLSRRGIDLEDHSQVHLMGFRQWEKLNRRVKKGSKAVFILAPVAITRKGKDGKPLLDEHGNEQKFTTYKSVPVFNVTDTEGDPLPEHPMVVPDGEVRPGVLTGLRDRIAEAGYAYEEKPTASNPERGEGTLGYTSPEGHVVVDNRLTDSAKANVLAHELAHIKCGHIENIAEYRQHRGRMETEAEMTAYLVSRELGADVADADSFSAAYIGGWSNGDPKVVRAAMATATKAYLEITEGTWPGQDAEETTRVPVLS